MNCNVEINYIVELEEAGGGMGIIVGTVNYIVELEG